MGLDHKVALVTGAAGAIGLATVRRLLVAGAKARYIFTISLLSVATIGAAFAASLAGIDATQVTSRAALARLPVIRKHELVERQKAARSATASAGPSASAAASRRSSSSSSTARRGAGPSTSRAGRSSGP